MSKKIQQHKAREYAKTIDPQMPMEERSESSNTLTAHCKPGTQLMNYTHKSKRLTGSEGLNTYKPESSGKRKLSNSISCNVIGGLYERSPTYQAQRKMSKYVQAKNKDLPRGDNCHNRRINSSISNVSISHRVSSSKSKSKKKKKKSSHMKSHSNIPVYQDTQISSRASAKKQFSDSKSKTKKKSKHIHHQSESNISTSISNKNNILMIDSAIGNRSLINAHRL